MFQFLIGSLKTGRKNTSPVNTSGVSIPHRQSKNETEEKDLTICTSRFNSS